jgi:phosphoribosylglycinamide formyltransferase 1
LSEPVALGVLASGTGTILESILAAGLPVELVVVDRACRAEALAEAAGVACARVERTFSAGFDRADFSLEVWRRLSERRVGLVAMAGFASVLSSEFFSRFGPRVLNTHPALLPAFPGWHAVERTLAAGVAVSGCTVHVATVEVDQGPILAQEEVPVLPGDTVDSLHERIKLVERRLYPAVIGSVLEHGGDPLSLLALPAGGARWVG